MHIVKSVFILILVAISSGALAQEQFSGTYFGTFFGTHDSGQFCIMVRTNGKAIVLFYDAVDEQGGVNTSVGINPNGTFSETNIDGQGTSISGAFTASNVSGSFVAGDGSVGNFLGSKASTSGFLREAGGYYRGPVKGVVTVSGIPQFSTSGTLHAVVSANGSACAYGRSSGGGQSAATGGFFSVLSSGQISATLLDGTFISGNLSSTDLAGNGTFSASLSGAIHSGTWSVTRQVALPNRAPVAANDNYQVAENRVLVVDAMMGVLSNDSDPDSDPIKAKLAAGPSNGTVSLNSGGKFTYTPDTGFFGNDSFTYRASDGLANSNIAKVAIKVEEGQVSAQPWLILLLDD